MPAVEGATHAGRPFCSCGALAGTGAAGPAVTPSCRRGVLFGMRRSLLLALLGGALGCGSPTLVLPSVELGTPFEMAPGDLVLLDGPDLTLRFIGVVDDSRCPEDALVLCAWAGTAGVRLATGASTMTDPHVFTLHSGQPPRSAEVGAYRVELVDVLPAARLEPPIAAAQYRVRLVVTRP
jgi:hypothetical protein